MTSLSRSRLTMLGLAVAWLLFASVTPAQAPYEAKAHYVKRELYIPMRDGVKLFTIVYAPRDRLSATRCS